MLSGIKFIPLIIIGLGTVIWGLPASHSLRHPFNIGASMAQLAGLALFLLGVLLTFIPDFFR